MGKLGKSIMDLFRPTPPHTAEELQRIAEARPATTEEIADVKDELGWKTNLPGSG